MDLFSEEYLAHHGILGQKWGKRNGPPYPLADSAKSPMERNASDSIDKRSHKSYDNKDADKSSHGLTAGQKKALIAGAAVVATGLAVYGAYKVGAFDGTKFNTQAIVDRFDAVQFDGVKTLGDDSSFHKKANATEHTVASALQDARVVNPSGAKHNCVACTACYDLRRRGYDVIAANRDHAAGINNFSLNELELVYSGVQDRLKTVNELVGSNGNPKSTMSQLSETLLKYGNGARGIFAGTFSEEAVAKWTKNDPGSGIPSGHAIAWEIIDGKVHYFDAQIGKERSAVGFTNSLFKHIDFNRTLVARLDDLEVDADFMPIMVKNRK